ncbi:MAG TPA: hypothetical protein PKV15_06110 [Syntrophomonadaceae bacterium]|jgi:hypothetical protein|nr:hypothetical protein [Syntrophomonadaceae bacterium]HRX21773.1 hypothetical protein [Syntrophomonadaceae bacterium]
MIYLSLAINCLLFFVLLNLSYIKNRRADPDYPEKPFSKLVVFPLTLGILFTILMDVMKGLMFYQILIFIFSAALLYLFFYVFNGKK